MMDNPSNIARRKAYLQQQASLRRTKGSKQYLKNQQRLELYRQRKSSIQSAPQLEDQGKSGSPPLETVSSSLLPNLGPTPKFEFQTLEQDDSSPVSACNENEDWPFEAVSSDTTIQPHTGRCKMPALQTVDQSDVIPVSVSPAGKIALSKYPYFSMHKDIEKNEHPGHLSARPAFGGIATDTLETFREDGLTPFPFLAMWAELCLNAAPRDKTHAFIKPVEMIDGVKTKNQLPDALRSRTTYLWPILHRKAYFLVLWHLKTRQMDCLLTSISSEAPLAWAKEQISAQWLRKHKHPLDWTTFSPGTWNNSCVTAAPQHSGLLLCALIRAVVLKEVIGYSEDRAAELRGQIATAFMEHSLNRA